MRWHGQVHRIERTLRGDYLLRIKHGMGIRVFDVTVRLDSSRKERLENLNRDEAVSYTGRLASFDPLIGYYLEDGDIE